MQCPNCGTEAPGTARFCQECGTALEVTCSDCGQRVAAEANFCPNCGQRLAEAQQAMAMSADADTSAGATAVSARDQPLPAAAVGTPPPPPGSAPPPARQAATIHDRAPRGAPPPAPQAAAGERHAFAGIMPRFFAMLVDTILIMGLAGIAVFAGMMMEDPEIMMLAYGVSGLISLLYVLVLEAGGGTIGKRLLGMRIVSAADGGKPGLGRAIVRNLMRIIDALPFFYLIGLLAIASSDRKQRLGDRAAGTLVLRNR